MTRETTQSGMDNPHVWYRTAKTTMVVAAVFAGIFTALLIANLVGRTIVGPSREDRLDAMRLQFQRDPENEALLAEIRELDLRIRRDIFWRLAFARTGAYMLLGSVVILLVAGKIAHDLSKELPRPRQVADRGELQMKEARYARWAVAGGAVVLVGGMVFLGMSGWVQFVQAQDDGPPFASWEEKQGQWHRFRGPEGAGVSAYTNIPTSWNGETGEGILWKTEVPLPGMSSPVVWKDRIFLTGADRNARHVYCFDADSGRLLWTGDVPTAPAGTKLEVMEDTGYAACTPATDGRRVYVLFPTGDVAAFDFHGRRLWHRHLGVPENVYGYASSLDTYEGLVLIQYDQGDAHDGKSKMIALDGVSGRTVWEAPRELPNSWASPVVVYVDGQPQLITLADPYAIAYNPADGTELWRAACVGHDVAPSAIYAGGLIIAVEPYAQTVAIRPTGQGNVTDTHVAWTMDEGAPDITSPVSDGQYVYLLETVDFLICCRLEDGEKIYEERLRGDFQASPSVVGDKLYVLDTRGVMRIARAGPEYEELGRAELGERCYASPAFADGRIYIRGVKHLYAIGQAP